MKKIVIDPGHGGTDPGAINGKHYEKNYTLDISLKAAEHLKNNYQIEVYLTRDSDKTVALMERSSYANRLNADLFVSVHVNAGGGSGFESYIYNSANLTIAQIQSKLHFIVANFYKALGFKNRGMKKANFSVLRNPLMPAILLENLFIDNPKDLNQLLKHQFINELGKIIGTAIAETFSLTTKPQNNSGLTPSPINPGPTPGSEEPQAAANEWDPEAEIEQLRKDGLVVNKHNYKDPVNWGEFATVLNRLRYSRTET